MLIYMDCCCLNRPMERAKEVQKHGIKPMDSLHFASAEYANVLLTVDRELMAAARRIDTSLTVANPGNWFMEEAGDD